MMRTILLALALCLPSHAAIAFVNASAGGPSTTTISTSAQNVAAGNLLYVFSRGGGTSCDGVTASISDTAGNTFNLVGYLTSYTAGACQAVWYAKNTLANATDVVTVVWSTAQIFSTISTQQFSGLDLTIPLDAVACTKLTNVAGTVATSGKFSTVAANEVIIAGGEWRTTGNTFTAGSGYTIPSGATDGSSIGTSEYKIVSATQSDVTASLTSSNSIVNGLFVVTFKQATVTAGTPTYVQSVNNKQLTTYTTSSASPAMSTTTGNLILAWVRMDAVLNGGTAQSCTGLVSSVTDTASNSYTLIGTVNFHSLANPTTENECMYAYIAKNITGNSANVVTAASGSALRAWCMVIQEFSGLSANAPFDQTASATSTSASSLTSGAFTTTTANQVIVAAGSQGHVGILFTSGTGYQIPVGGVNYSTVPNPDNGSLGVENKFVSSTQTGATASMTFDTSDRAGLLVVTLSQTDIATTVRHRAISQ